MFTNYSEARTGSQHIFQSLSGFQLPLRANGVALPIQLSRVGEPDILTAMLKADPAGSAL